MKLAIRPHRLPFLNAHLAQELLDQVELRYAPTNSDNLLFPRERYIEFFSGQRSLACPARASRRPRTNRGTRCAQHVAADALGARHARIAGALGLVQSLRSRCSR